MGSGPDPAAGRRAFAPHNPAEVRWSSEYWRSHVVARHPEMEGHEDEAEKAIADPLAVYQSDTHEGRAVFYRPSGLPPPFNGGFVRVIVEYSRSGGILITAHHIWQAKAREEVMVWPRD